MEDKRLFTKCQRELGLLLGDNYTPILVENNHTPVFTELRVLTGDPDYTYSLELPEGNSIRIAVELKRNLRSSMIPLLQKQKDRLLGQSSHEQFMVFTDYVSQGMGDALRSGGIWFVDEAGNGFLEIQGQLLINAMGKKLRRASLTKGQYYSAHGSRVLLFLIEHGPEIAATYSDIQASVDISMGKISRVMTELLDSEVLAKRAQGDYLVTNPTRLLDMWTSSFVEKTQPRMLIARYRSPYGTDFERMLGEHAGSEFLNDVVIGGEYAADLLTGNLRPSSINMYIPLNCESEIRQELVLAPAADGEVTLYQTIATGLDAPMEELRFKLAAPSLVYAELLATDDPRCGETASIIRDRWMDWIP